MVLSMNEWMAEQGYEPFAHVVEVTPQRYQLEVLTDDGVPRTPELEGIIEFLNGMASGEVLKGGNRAARDTNWYASSCWGRAQAEQLMC